jgi:hypothetical protein
MAVNCSGDRPPQETGLVYNSWFGKFHLEMHWWHAVHFALWDRLPLLERSLTWYQSILPMARATAQLQGYEGVRWPKMASPDGRDSPAAWACSDLAAAASDLLRRAVLPRPRRPRGLSSDIVTSVFETAAFMAS